MVDASHLWRASGSTKVRMSKVLDGHLYEVPFVSY
jgi:hypothetical protein